MKRTASVLAGALLGLSAMSLQAETLKMAYDSDPVTLDPHEQLSGGMLQLSHMAFDPLVRWDQSMGFEARLAEKWERIDDLTMRFHLRKGVKFHSGNEMTAKDVAFTFSRLQTSPDYKGIFTPFKELKVIDDYTFDLVTNEPFPLILNNATYIFPMDSRFYSGEDEQGNPKDMLVKHGNSLRPAISREPVRSPFPIVSRAYVLNSPVMPITGIKVPAVMWIRSY